MPKFETIIDMLKYLESKGVVKLEKTNIGWVCTETYGTQSIFRTDEFDFVREVEQRI